MLCTKASLRKSCCLGRQGSATRAAASQRNKIIPFVCSWVVIADWFDKRDNRSVAGYPFRRSTKGKEAVSDHGQQGRDKPRESTPASAGAFTPPQEILEAVVLLPSRHVPINMPLQPESSKAVGIVKKWRGSRMRPLVPESVRSRSRGSLPYITERCGSGRDGSAPLHPIKRRQKEEKRACPFVLVRTRCAPCWSNQYTSIHGESTAFTPDQDAPPVRSSCRALRASPTRSISGSRLCIWRVGSNTTATTIRVATASTGLAWYIARFHSIVSSSSSTWRGARVQR
jgi:hypothetical protein